MSGRVGYKDDNTFKFIITNFTKGVATVIETCCSIGSNALRSTAEWIVEVPFAESDPIFDFQTVTFNYCSAVINGIHGRINNENWMNDDIILEKDGNVVAQPTELLKNGYCFQVKWQSE